MLGFTQDTLVATERSQAYQVSIDVSKGFSVHGIDLRQLVYRVSVEPDSTAGMSSLNFGKMMNDH